MHTQDATKLPSVEPHDGKPYEGETARAPSRSHHTAIVLAAGLLALWLAGIWLAEGPSLVTRPDCASIGDARLRLKCYDDLAHQNEAQPARGAMAPKIN